MSTQAGLLESYAARLSETSVCSVNNQLCEHAVNQGPNGATRTLRATAPTCPILGHGDSFFLAGQLSKKLGSSVAGLPNRTQDTSDWDDTIASTSFFPVTIASVKAVASPPALVLEHFTRVLEAIGTAVAGLAGVLTRGNCSWLVQCLCFY